LRFEYWSAARSVLSSTMYALSYCSANIMSDAPCMNMAIVSARLVSASLRMTTLFLRIAVSASLADDSEL
jgi:hypothetical protein